MVKYRELKLILERDNKDGDIDLVIPGWIADKFSQFLLLQFDGEKLTLQSAE